MFVAMFDCLWHESCSYDSDLTRQKATDVAFEEAARQHFMQWGFAAHPASLLGAKHGV